MTEILVLSAESKLGETLMHAVTELKQQKSVVLAGINHSISRAVELAEFIRHSRPNLHCNMRIDAEEAKTKLLISLSFNKPVEGPGYSPPIPVEELNELSWAELEKPSAELIA
jgi:DNA-binding protein